MLEERRKGEQWNFNVAVSCLLLPANEKQLLSQLPSLLRVCVCVFVLTFEWVSDCTLEHRDLVC